MVERQQPSTSAAATDAMMTSSAIMTSSSGDIEAVIETQDHLPADVRKKKRRLEAARKQRKRFTKFVIRIFPPIFLQAFTLTFLAEWGDRSQFTTIVLGASEVK